MNLEKMANHASQDRISMERRARAHYQMRSIMQPGDLANDILDVVGLKIRPRRIIVLLLLPLPRRFCGRRTHSHSLVIFESSCISI